MTTTINLNEAMRNVTITARNSGLAKNATGESLTLRMRPVTYAELLDAHDVEIKTTSRERLAAAFDRVKGWEDVVDQEGNPVPFSPGSLQALFAQKPELFFAFNEETSAQLYGRGLVAAGKSQAESEPPAEAEESSTRSSDDSSA